MHLQLRSVDLFNTLNWIPFRRNRGEDVRSRRITPCEVYIILLFIVLIVVSLFMRSFKIIPTLKHAHTRPKLVPRLHLSVPPHISDIKGCLRSLAAIHQIAVVIY